MINTIIAGSVLGKAARAVKAIAGKDSYNRDLDFARIWTTAYGIEIKCSNIDAWLRYSIECETIAGSQAFVDAGRLAGAVKGRKGAQTFEIDAVGTLHIGALAIENQPADFAIEIGRAHV